MIVLRAVLAGLLGAGMAYAGAAASSGILKVHTSQPSNQMASVVEAFRKNHPDVNVALLADDERNKRRFRGAFGD